MNAMVDYDMFCVLLLLFIQINMCSPGSDITRVCNVMCVCVCVCVSAIGINILD